MVLIVMKNILIIGGSSGIGKELSTMLSQNGDNVFATYNNNNQSNSTNLNYFKFDVLNDSFNSDDLPETIDGLVYCPGTINLKPFARIKEEEFVEDYKLQVIGAIKVIQEILPRLKKAENASIVLYSTVAVQTGFNFHSQVSASKGAIEGLTRALSAEFAPRIRVNAVAPSITNTPLASRLLNSEQKIEDNAKRHPLNRIGEAKDIANITKFLLSDESSWITGQIIKVDGGISTIK